MKLSTKQKQPKNPTYIEAYHIQITENQRQKDYVKRNHSGEKHIKQQKKDFTLDEQV